MQRLGDNFLTRTTFTDNQHREIVGGQSADGVPNGPYRLAFANDAHALRDLIGELTMASRQVLPFLRILQRNGRLDAQFLKNLIIVVVEVTFPAVDHFKGANALFLTVEQWYTKQIARLVARFDIDFFIEAAVVVRIVHTDRAAGLDDLTNNSQVVRQPEFASFNSQCRTGHQFLLFLVPDKDAGPVGSQQPSGFLGDQFQQRAGVGGSGKMRCNSQCRFQLRNALGSSSPFLCGTHAGRQDASDNDGMREQVG